MLCHALFSCSTVTITCLADFSVTVTAIPATPNIVFSDFKCGLPILLLVMEIDASLTHLNEIELDLLFGAFIYFNNSPVSCRIPRP